MKLTAGQMHLLRLIKRGKDADGWTSVSENVWPFVENLPSKLCELRKAGKGGFARLTHDGETVLEWCVE